MAHHTPTAVAGLRLTKLDDAAVSPMAQSGDYDALTELFLGPSVRTAPAGIRAGEQAAAGAGMEAAICIEGLILGHLPVMASAWAMQYARARSAEVGTGVAVLRVRGDEVSIEVVGGGVAAMSPAATLEEGLIRGASCARHWLVRIDGTDEATLAEHVGLDSVTLLSSADQAAVVGAYGTIKRLFSADGGPGAGGAQHHRPRVRIVLVGSADDRAVNASASLAKAARAFLEREVEVVNGPQRIGGGAAPATLVYRGESLAVARLLEQLRRVLERTAPQHGNADGEIGSDAGDGRDDGRHDVRGELDRHLVRVMEQAATESVSRSGATGAAFGGNAAATETSTQGIEEEPSPASGRDGLSRHVGLTMLAVRCPYVPWVELAADGEGRLHLLTHAEGSEDPMQGLLKVAAWSRAHRQLLEMASPALRDAGMPVLHLFVADARRGIDLGEIEVRLHLLAPIVVGGHAGWYCTELN